MQVQSYSLCELATSTILTHVSLTTGRTLRVHVHDYFQISTFLKKAVQAAFDWVFYDNSEYVRLSVIPDSKWDIEPVYTYSIQ